MTLNILKWRPSAGKSKVPNAGSIGEPDAHVFNCPKCARPLSDGTPRCPGCGTRLIMGVVFRRASILMGFGFVIGVFLGGVVTSIVITTLLHAPSTEAVSQTGDPAGPVGSRAPGASAAPAAPVIPIPAVALSSLRQMTLLDARIVADAGSLSSALQAKKSAVDLALVLRSIASDATIGADLVPQVQSWDDAYQFAADRQSFYDSVLAVAGDGLRASLSDKTAYRLTARKMLNVLRGLPALDAASRELATTAKVNLPKVDLRPVGGTSGG
jgi:hypothetical protein